MKLNLPISEKKDILAKAIKACRNSGNLDDLFNEICAELKRRNIDTDIDLIESILDV